MEVLSGPGHKEEKPEHVSLTQLLREVKSGRRMVPGFVGHCIGKEEAIQRKFYKSPEKSLWLTLWGPNKQPNRKTGIGILKSRVETYLK